MPDESRSRHGQCRGTCAGGHVTAPIGVVLLAGIPAVLVMIAPGVAAAFGVLTTALPLLMGTG